MFKKLAFIKNYILVNTLWKVSKKSYLKSINLFSATEADTVWQLVHGIDKLDKPEDRADFFRQIVEEDSHAELFDKIVRKSQNEVNFKTPLQEKRFLYNEEDPVWKLLAYCYVGEGDATRKFIDIRKASSDPELTATLSKIIHDESNHVGQAYSILKGLGASEKNIKREILRIRIVRKYESLVRTAKKVFELLVNLFLGLIYFLFGWVLRGSSRKKLRINE